MAAKNNSLMSDIPALKNAVDNAVSDYVKTPSTNNTWTSNSNNNPYGLFFDDCSPRFGVERFMIGGLEAITGPFSSDSTGKPGFYLIDARTGRADKRFAAYGAWSLTDGGSYVHFINSNVAGDYVSITGVMSKINLVAPNYTGGGVISIYLNGTDTTNNVQQNGANVLNGQNYQSNSIFPISSTITSTGLNTVKLVRDDTGNAYFFGFELINEQYDATHNIHVPAGTMVIAGEEITFPAFVGANALNYKGAVNANTGSELYVGTKGARQAWFAKKDPTTSLGAWVAKHTDVEEQVQAGATTSTSVVGSLSDATKYYTNSQGNITRLIRTADTGHRLLLVPTSATGTTLTYANDYDGVAHANVFTTSGQFKDNGTTAVSIGTEAVNVELYGKCLANADFTNSELQREIHWREFGAGRSDDFSTLTTARSATFTLDDGVTTLAGNNPSESSGWLTCTNQVGNHITLTFVGTGLEVLMSYFQAAHNDLWVDGVRAGVGNLASGIPTWVKMCSDLPMGTHTVKLSNFNGGNIYLSTFRIYQPKTPVLAGYKPAWTTNLLADFIATNLPTRNSSHKNGPVDQGAMRKQIKRDFIYSGTWEALENTDTDGPALARLRVLATNSGEFSLNVFGASNYRWLTFFNGTADTIDILIDGTVITNELAMNSLTSGYGSLLKSDMGSLGTHTITFRRGAILTNSTFYHYGIDYSTPLYEPAQWKTNPYLDYLVGSNSVGNQLQIGSEKLVDVVREYKTYTTVASSTVIPTTPLIIAAQVLDKGKWDVSVDLTAYKSSTNDSGITLALYVDGVSLVQRSVKWYSSVMNTILPVYINNYEVTLHKRSTITFTVSSGASDYTFYSNTVPAYIKVRKISN